MSSSRVLIIGAGIAGLETADILAAEGVDAVVVEKTASPGGIAREIGHPESDISHRIESVKNNGNIEIRTSTEPVRITGVSGAFKVVLADAAGEMTEEPFTHIVFAHGLDWLYPPEFSLPENESSMHLLDAERRRVAGTFPEGDGRIVYLIGFTDYASSFLAEMAFRQALSFRKQGRPVMVVTDMIRFDHGWVPDLFRECREAGVIFVKTPEPPVLESADSGYRFRVLDPGLELQGRPVYLTGTAACVVVEPVCRPRDTDTLFWSPHRLDRDDAGFHPEENLHYTPVKSGRAGIYLVGAVTGPKDMNACRREAAAVAADILGQPSPHPTAVVDESKCAACLTCVRLCPHHAIVMDRVARIAPEACFGCGTCVAECPAEAISLAEPDGTPVVEQDITGSGITVFCCEGSTRAALDKAREKKLIPVEKLDVHPLPCSGNVDLLDILEAFKQGAEGVFIATCQDHNCKHIQGNRRAERRAARARSILKELGIPPQRVFTGAFASNMYVRLAGELNRFIKEVES